MAGFIVILVIIGLCVVLVATLRQAKEAHEKMDKQNAVDLLKNDSGYNSANHEHNTPIYDQAFIDSHAGAIERAIREMNRDNDRTWDTWFRGPN